MTYDPCPHWFRATTDIPVLGVWRGDLVRYNPTAEPEVTVVRRLPPDHGRLLLAIDDGLFTRVSADPSVSSLAVARESRRHPVPRPCSPGSTGRQGNGDNSGDKRHTATPLRLVTSTCKESEGATARDENRTKPAPSHA